MPNPTVFSGFFNSGQPLRTCGVGNFPAWMGFFHKVQEKSRKYLCMTSFQGIAPKPSAFITSMATLQTLLESVILSMPADNPGALIQKNKPSQKYQKHAIQ